MKQIAFALSAAGIILLVIVGLFTIEGKSSVERNLKTAVRESAYDSLQEAVTDRLDNRQLSLLFRSNLIAKLSDVDDPGEDVRIDITSIDTNKGILSVNVTRAFTYPNGNTGKASADCTVILEEEKQRNMYTVRYYIPWQEARDMGLSYRHGEYALAAEYLVEEGRRIPLPAGFESVSFWIKDEDRTYSNSELAQIKAGKDLDIYV